VFHPAVLPLTTPGEGQVQITVAAIAVNPVDLQTRAGSSIPAKDARFPMVLGWDAAGTIAAIGEGVRDWQVGDRVAAMTFQPLDQNGTYTQYLNLAAHLVAPVPPGLTLPQAATLPLAGLTASQMVRWLDVPAGGTLLVNAPLGAVGRLAVQLAHHAGVNVVAVVTPAQREQAIELGATDTVDRGEFTDAVRELHPGGVHAAIDLIGGATSHTTLAAVRDGGAYATSVLQYNDPSGAFTPQRGIRLHPHTVHPDTPALTDLLQAASRGELTTAIEATYPLADAEAAHRRQAQGNLRGKLVLTP